MFGLVLDKKDPQLLAEETSLNLNKKVADWPRWFSRFAAQAYAGQIGGIPGGDPNSDHRKKNLSPRQSEIHSVISLEF